MDSNSYNPFDTMLSTRLLLMVKLFETGKLTVGQAAELAGYSKPTFIELLGKLGVPMIDYPPEELEQEMNF